jgi:hypothetical protein
MKSRPFAEQRERRRCVAILNAPKSLDKIWLQAGCCRSLRPVIAVFG